MLGEARIKVSVEEITRAWVLKKAGKIETKVLQWKEFDRQWYKV